MSMPCVGFFIAANPVTHTPQKNVTPVSLNMGTDSRVSLWTSATSAYPTCAVTVKILDSSLAEIGAGTNVDIFILNSSGGYTGRTSVAYETNGCTINSPTFGSDCLVAVAVHSATPFNVIATQKNLSTATTVTLTQDTTPPDTIAVTITGDVAGYYGQLTLCTPYGTFGAGTIELSGNPAIATLNVTNPSGYPGVWSQVFQTTVGGASKMLMAVGSAAPIAATVTLPTVQPIGATTLPDPNSIDYTGGTLSIAEITGVNYYQFYLHNVTDGVPVGTVISTGRQVDLPAWLQSALAGREVYVGLTPVGVDVTLDVPLVGAITGAHNGPPAVPMHVGVLTGTYSKVITF